MTRMTVLFSRLLACLWAFAIAASGCGATGCSPSGCAAPAAQKPRAPDPPRPYAFWTSDDDDRARACVAEQRPCDAALLGVPDGAAWPVAPGLFLVTLDAMGPAATDMGHDAHVAVLGADGRTRPGEFADVDFASQLGLVRSAFSPPAYALADRSMIAANELVALARQANPIPESRPVTMEEDCQVEGDKDRDGVVLSAEVACSRQDRLMLPGTGFVAANGRLVALLYPLLEKQQLRGRTAVHLRRFLEQYLDSGGRDIRPRPAF